MFVSMRDFRSTCGVSDEYLQPIPAQRREVTPLNP